MSDHQDLIRRGDALERFPDGRQPWPAHRIRSAIAALPAVTDPQIATLQAERAKLVEALRVAGNQVALQSQVWADDIDDLLAELGETK